MRGELSVFVVRDGQQQEIGRHVTPTCVATADSEWLVATRACSDIRNVTLS